MSKHAIVLKWAAKKGLKRFCSIVTGIMMMLATMMVFGFYLSAIFPTILWIVEWHVLREHQGQLALLMLLSSTLVAIREAYWWKKDILGNPFLWITTPFHATSPFKIKGRLSFVLESFYQWMVLFAAVPLFILSCLVVLLKLGLKGVHGLIHLPSHWSKVCDNVLENHPEELSKMEKTTLQAALPESITHSHAKRL